MSCYGDAKLDEESPTVKYCHNKSLINRVFSASRWYYVLTIGFMVNFCIIVVLIVYILRWRRNHRSVIAANLESGSAPFRPGGGGPLGPGSSSGPRLSNGSIMGNGTHAKKKSSWPSVPGVVGKNNNKSMRGYSPVKSSETNPMSTVPFHDYDTSSEDDEMYRKPYTDEIKT